MCVKGRGRLMKAARVPFARTYLTDRPQKEREFLQS